MGADPSDAETAAPAPVTGTGEGRVGPAEVLAAAGRIEPYAHRTPVMTCSSIDARARREVFFKCENLQKVGAFKFRGARNAVMRLTDDAAAAGVVTHSSGNHAQALALAARLRGIDAHIVMPDSALPCKRAAVEGYGGRVYSCGPTEADRLQRVAIVVEQTGATLIPPFDHPDIIAGQATAAAELIGQIPDLDAIIAPVGGGGLLAGTCIAAAAYERPPAVLGAEPAGADDAHRSLAAGKRIPLDRADTICDGLRTSVGELTWPIIRDGVRAIFTAPDPATVDAMRLVWERMKLIVEPSAAVALAALLSGAAQELLDEMGAERVGLIVSGGNADLDELPWARGGVTDGAAQPG